jgi:hypothetical protein
VTKDAGPFPLNEPQRRRFAVILASLEDALDAISSAAADSAPDTRRMTALANDLPEGFLQQAAPAIAALRRELTQLADALHLEAHPESKARLVRSVLTGQLNQIQDSYARKLRGYGRVDPELAPQLDPIMEAMEAALIELRSVLKRR